TEPFGMQARQWQLPTRRAASSNGNASRSARVGNIADLKALSPIRIARVHVDTVRGGPRVRRKTTRPFLPLIARLDPVHFTSGRPTWRDLFTRLEWPRLN